MDETSPFMQSKFGVGQPVRRTEDPVLLRGGGALHKTDDLALEGGPAPRRNGALDDGARGGVLKGGGRLRGARNARCRRPSSPGADLAAYASTCRRRWRGSFKKPRRGSPMGGSRRPRRSRPNKMVPYRRATRSPSSWSETIAAAREAAEAVACRTSSACPPSPPPADAPRRRRAARPRQRHRQPRAVDFATGDEDACSGARPRPRT